MIAIYPAESRHSTNHGWLKSNFSFSFADYYDPDNMSFGPLRVFNDDFVKPLKGFGMHGHREMEIVSVILKGQLKHEDSMGNSEIIREGQVQRMSAGRGIMHSETNPSAEEEVNFLQLWFQPAEHGLPPSYETITFNADGMKNALLPVVSGRGGRKDGVAVIHQDITMYLSELDAGHSIAFEQEEGRRIYVFVIEGELLLNGENKLRKRDAARIEGTAGLAISSESGAKLMVIDLP
ncbi:pirin family protein [Paenibacillus alkalitolerans]|uniref:pirin family protein n=1 Tax=Paenibacillus alkalitolerans TaxID=2799335 RepID=UPI0018F73346|nr:pirin family protein [Paenibacillus alkalitolerans]